MTTTVNTTNINLDKNPDMIWGMIDSDDKICLRFDCGDAGMIVLTREQGLDLMQQLKTLTRPKPGFLVAEPKPTPSDHKLSPCMEHSTDVYGRCEFCGQIKPQPDSSSTHSNPVAKGERECVFCGWRWFPVHDDEQCPYHDEHHKDSSSISSEQTHGQQLKEPNDDHRQHGRTNG